MKMKRQRKPNWCDDVGPQKLGVVSLASFVRACKSKYHHANQHRAPGFSLAGESAIAPWGCKACPVGARAAAGTLTVFPENVYQIKLPDDLSKPAVAVQVAEQLRHPQPLPLPKEMAMPRKPSIETKEPQPRGRHAAKKKTVQPPAPASEPESPTEAAPDPAPAAQQVSMADAISIVCKIHCEILQAKNASYGNSAADPVRIFSKADPLEQINVRIDDKLSRLIRGHGYPGDNDEDDLIGYLLLKKAVRIYQASSRPPAPPAGEIRPGLNPSDSVENRRVLPGAPKCIGRGGPVCDSI
jgi:hypothetical protein